MKDSPVKKKITGIPAICRQEATPTNSTKNTPVLSGTASKAIGRSPTNLVRMDSSGMESSLGRTPVHMLMDADEESRPKRYNSMFASSRLHIPNTPKNASALVATVAAESLIPMSAHKRKSSTPIRSTRRNLSIDVTTPRRQSMIEDNVDMSFGVSGEKLKHARTRADHIWKNLK